MDLSLPGSSVHGISQAGMLEWVAISYSRESSQPRDRTQVSHIAPESPKNTGVGSLSLLQQIFPTQESNLVSCIAGGFFTTEPPGKSTNSGNNKVKSETPSFSKIFYFFKFILIGG